MEKGSKESLMTSWDAFSFSSLLPSLQENQQPHNGMDWANIVRANTSMAVSNSGNLGYVTPKQTITIGGQHQQKSPIRQVSSLSNKVVDDEHGGDIDLDFQSLNLPISPPHEETQISASPSSTLSTKSTNMSPAIASPPTSPPTFEQNEQQQSLTSPSVPPGFVRSRPNMGNLFGNSVGGGTTSTGVDLQAIAEDPMHSLLKQSTNIDDHENESTGMRRVMAMKKSQTGLESLSLTFGGLDIAEIDTSISMNESTRRGVGIKSLAQPSSWTASSPSSLGFGGFGSPSNETPNTTDTIENDTDTIKDTWKSFFAMEDTDRFNMSPSSPSPPRVLLQSPCEEHLSHRHHTRPWSVHSPNTIPPNTSAHPSPSLHHVGTSFSSAHPQSMPPPPPPPPPPSMMSPSPVASTTQQQQQEQLYLQRWNEWMSYVTFYQQQQQQQASARVPSPPPQQHVTPTTSPMYHGNPYSAQSPHGRTNTQFGMGIGGHNLHHPSMMGHSLGTPLPPVGLGGIPTGSPSNHHHHHHHRRTNTNINGIMTNAQLQLVCEALLEYRTTGARPSMQALMGNVVEFSRDSHGSRFIQFKMETASEEEKQMLIDEVIPEAVNLMQDTFGNYVIQNFLEHSTPSQRFALANTMRGHMVGLSSQPHGCRAVQRALDLLALPQRNLLLGELLLSPENVSKCSKNSHATHVLQKTVGLLLIDDKEGRDHEQEQQVDPVLANMQYPSSSELLRATEHAIAQDFMEYANHGHAYRFVITVMDDCNPKRSAEMEEILSIIRANQQRLAMDQHGNFILQHILNKGSKEQKDMVQNFVCSRVIELSCHKFGSHLVEKVFSCASQTQVERLIDQLLQPTKRNLEQAKALIAMHSNGSSSLANNMGKPRHHSKHQKEFGNGNDFNSPLLLLMKDAFGNFVIQRAFDASRGKLRSRLAHEIRSYSDLLQRFTYGRHILLHIQRVQSGDDPASAG